MFNITIAVITFCVRQCLLIAFPINTTPHMTLHKFIHHIHYDMFRQVIAALPDDVITSRNKFKWTWWTNECNIMYGARKNNKQTFFEQVWQDNITYKNLHITVYTRGTLYVFHINGRTQMQGVSEQATEEDIWI
jgi:hypothetical protein